MCGIAGIYLKNKRVKVTQENLGLFCDRLLLEIEERGRHATGYVSIGWNGSIKLDKAAIPASEFVNERDPFQDKVQAVLLHTRFKTKGSWKIMGNNHPVSCETCFVTHNGSIKNDDELFEKEELKRNWEVDSEVIPAILHKYGLKDPDTIREGLEKLEGAMAIACYDPVRFPSKLILARGKTSPLYVFENDNVIVWASTRKAIKDTWGDLVGTPPKDEKIRCIAEGKFLIAQDYQALGEYEFKPKHTDTYNYSGGVRGVVQRTRAATRRHAHPPVDLREGHTFQRPWDSAGPFNTIDEFKAALARLRANPPEDYVLARRWDLKETYKKADYADVEGTVEWPNCICGHAVLMQDMKRHVKYGLICKDCYRITYFEWDKKGKAWEKEQVAAREAILGDIAIREIPAADKRNLESWAEIEVKLHRLTLNKLSDLTGFTTFGLDFLLFRTAGKSSEYGAGMVHLKFGLLKAYEKVYEMICEANWEDTLREVNDDHEVNVDEAQELARQQMFPWTAFTEQTVDEPRPRVRYICDIHNETFNYSEHCHACIFNDADDLDDGGDEEGFGSEDALAGRDRSEGWCDGEGDECGVEVFAKHLQTPVTPIRPDMEKCDKCGTFYYELCVTCSKAEKDNITVDACCCKTTRDRKCKHKLKIVVRNSRVGTTQWGYCGLHWNRCSAPKCANKANFTHFPYGKPGTKVPGTGQRYCHAHSRGKQGFADAAAIKDGALSILMEVL